MPHAGHMNGTGPAGKSNFLAAFGTSGNRGFGHAYA